MAFDFDLPPDLKAKLETAAYLYGETPEHMVLLAIAEKLARLEHDEWLAAEREARQSAGKPDPAATPAPAEVAGCAEKQPETEHPEK